MQVVEGGVEAQAEQAFKNLKAVVEAGGAELGKVVKTTVRRHSLQLGISLCTRELTCVFLANE
jgi:hypothetical protein